MFDKTLDWVIENKKIIFWIISLTLVSILSFGLGYLVNREFSHVPIIIEKCSSL